MMDKEKRNCYECAHFHITWEKDFPNGCRFFGFKSNRLPSTVVKETSGKDCAGFERKKGK